MKKKAYFLALGITILGLSGCGKSADKETETQKTTVVETTEKAREESTTVKETEKVTEKETETKETESRERRVKKEETTENTTEVVIDDKKEATLENAKPFVGKSLDELTNAVGNYKNFETAGACLEDENELNGIATYDNFTVYCHSINGQTKWIIDAIE